MKGNHKKTRDRALSRNACSLPEYLLPKAAATVEDTLVQAIAIHGADAPAARAQHMFTMPAAKKLASPLFNGTVGEASNRFRAWRSEVMVAVLIQSADATSKARS